MIRKSLTPTAIPYQIMEVENSLDASRLQCKRSTDCKGYCAVIICANLAFEDDEIVRELTASETLNVTHLGIGCQHIKAAS